MVSLEDRNLHELLRDAQEKIEAIARTSIEAADVQFRETHAGLPVDVIIADFPDFGPKVNLSTDGLTAYAHAVSSGEPFAWRLSA